MKCDDIRDILSVYWSLPDDDSRRAAVDKHILTCEACEAEFRIWEESEKFLNSEMEFIPDEQTEESMESSAVSSQVMSRIYSDESWRLPVQNRMYAISDKMRRNLMLVLACCLAMFVTSFLFSIVDNISVEDSSLTSDHSIYSIQTPQMLKTTSEDADSYTVNMDMTTAVASVSQTFMEPIPFHMGPIHSYSNFLLIISILGFIAAILVMNWFSRVKV